MKTEQLGYTLNMNKIHELKTLQPFFGDVRCDAKSFEVRKNDREFEVGDILILREWDGEKYTNDFTGRVITYVLPRWAVRH